MTRTVYLVEVAPYYAKGGYAVSEGPLPETPEDLMAEIEDVLKTWGDDAHDLRITRVDWDIPPQDVTEDAMRSYVEWLAKSDLLSAGYPAVLDKWGAAEKLTGMEEIRREDAAHERAERFRLQGGKA